MADNEDPVVAARESGLVLAVPRLTGVVDRWRLGTVPVAALGVPAHVTALYPWVPAPATDESLARLRESVRALAPVTLTFRELGTFPSGVLYLRPEPEDQVRHLSQVLQSAFPGCLPYGGEFPDPVPHLTVAFTEPAALPELQRDVEEALAGDLPVTVTVTHLTVMEQQHDGRWIEAHHVGLGQSPTSEQAG